MCFFRIGADQFVILTSASELALAEEIAKKILSYSGDEMKWSQGSFRFSLSIGIALIPAELSDAKDALERADAAMMNAKKNGRCTYSVQ